MKLVRIEFEQCINLGNYEHEKIRLAAEVDAGKQDIELTVAETVSLLRDRIASVASIDINTARFKQRQMQRELDRLHQELETARSNVERVNEFMVKQGLKKESDVAGFPELTKLLPSPDDSQESLQFEVVEDDEDLHR